MKPLTIHEQPHWGMSKTVTFMLLAFVALVLWRHIVTQRHFEEPGHIYCRLPLDMPDESDLVVREVEVVTGIYSDDRRPICLDGHNEYLSLGPVGHGWLPDPFADPFVADVPDLVISRDEIEKLVDLELKRPNCLTD